MAKQNPTIEKLKEEALDGIDTPIASSVSQAISMIQEMCKHTSPLTLSKQLGLAYPTVGKLSKGKGNRISDDVFKKIQSFYNDWKSGTVTLAIGRTPKPKSGGEVPIPFSKSSGTFTLDRKALLRERENLMAKVNAIDQLLKLY